MSGTGGDRRNEVSKNPSNCDHCGAGQSFLVPVWEDLDDFWGQQDPDYIGCTECHTMTEVNC